LGEEQREWGGDTTGTHDKKRKKNESFRKGRRKGFGKFIAKRKQVGGLVRTLGWKERGCFVFCWGVWTPKKDGRGGLKISPHRKKTRDTEWAREKTLGQGGGKGHCQPTIKYAITLSLPKSPQKGEISNPLGRGMVHGLEHNKKEQKQGVRWLPKRGDCEKSSSPGM